MRRALTPWNLLGLLVFLLGLWAFWQGQANPSTSALPLLPQEAPQPRALPLTLYRPDPPRGLLKENRTVEIAPGEAPEAAVIQLWAQAAGAPPPLGVYWLGKTLVVDLPANFAQGLDASGETLRTYSLAYTLLATFPKAEEVRFLVAGRPSPGLAHLDLQKPIRLP